jgi:DNA-binding GntR family transcriptional regulator
LARKTELSTSSAFRDDAHLGGTDLPLDSSVFHLDIRSRRGFRVAASLAAVEEVALMRSVLEGLALRHGIHSAGDSAVDAHARDEANRRLYRLLLAPFRMPLLLSSIGDQHLVGSRFVFATCGSDFNLQIDLDHLSILGHLRKGEVDQAIVVIGRHVQRIGRTHSRSASNVTGPGFATEG